MKQKGKDIVQDGMMNYSAYVLLQRAIPNLYDGLKISYRRILYSMYQNKINNFTKSQNIVGEVSKIHPHGSSYGTMVGMIQKDRHVYPFIDGKGYFGEYTSRDVSAAAERYTNVKMNDYGKHLLKDIHKQQVSFSPSYDGTQELPDLLPVKFPIILAFAQSGMGVGFSSTTASFNIPEIADSVINYLKNGQVNLLVPDFATGGTLLLNKDVINSINHTGCGTLRIRAKAEINKNTISITEIPYSTTREAIIDRVVKLVKEKKLDEVINIQDLTGLNKMEILITTKKNTDMNILLEKLYKLTPLESTYSVNSTVLFENRPVLMGVVDILKQWIKWRSDCVKKELEYDISKLELDRIEIAALKAISKGIDTVIDTVRFKNKTEAISIIRNTFELTFAQSEYIYGLHLRQLNDDYIKKQLQKLKDIETQIKTLKNTDPYDVIIEDMEYYKKTFNALRRTEIVDIKEIEEVSDKVKKVIEKELTDNSDYWISITKNMYIYKTKNKKLTIKGDRIEQQYKLNNAEDEVFVYTHSRNGYKLQIKDLEIYSGSGLGDYLPALLDVNKSDIDKIGISSKYYPVIVLILSTGRIVKFGYEAYRAGVNVFANTHTDKFSITHCLFLDKDKNIDLEDKEGNKYRINTKDIRETKTRAGTGQFIHASRRNDIEKVK